MLIVMGDQDNTIRVLSRILGQEYNEQHLHDMHNSLFGGLVIVLVVLERAWILAVF